MDDPIAGPGPNDNQVGTDYTSEPGIQGSGDPKAVPMSDVEKVDHLGK